MLVDELHGRNFAGGRQHVVHERAGEQLPFGIVVEFLEQRAADALRGAADDLSLDQHRIDHHAAIMRDDVFLDAHAPELDVDLDAPPRAPHRTR